VRAWLALAFAAILLAGCGGGSGSPSSPSPSPPAAAANVAAMVVDGGTDGSSFNTPFVSVTVCQPGTSACVTIDHVVVDTGSFGLRLPASAVPAAITLPLVNAPGGAPLGECTQFVQGFAWGSVRSADVAIAGERASAIPIQLVKDPTGGFATPPTACSNTGSSFDITSGGANGILGVGIFAQDCGQACAGSSAPGVYFACSAAGCSPTVAPLPSQVVNPVATFATDNNGVALVLPSVALGGVASVSGSLIFGIGTQSNNQPGSVQVFHMDDTGNFTTTYKGKPLNGFLDSGSNGLIFPDPSLPQCAGGLFCPASAQNLSAVVASRPNGSSTTVNFVVDSPTSPTFNANASAVNIGFNDGSPAPEFDWGLPFFFGRTVWTAINGTNTPLGSGPFWAF